MTMMINKADSAFLPFASVSAKGKCGTASGVFL